MCEKLGMCMVGVCCFVGGEMERRMLGMGGMSLSCGGLEVELVVWEI